jgi:hypothetical protein
MHYQHRAVARGPKLTFREFSGEDVEGWIRKAEKYFELVGVPNEDRVQTAIMYTSGKAEFWWRGTGCNARTLPWHQFCRMASDKFNVISDYEIVGQFHNLKQMGTIVDYVDRFEEMVTMVKRHNPTLSDNYFISSFISGLKGQIQYHVQCHKPVTLPQAFWYAKRLEQSVPTFKKFTSYTPPNKIQTKSSENAPKVIEAKEKLPAQTLTELRAAGKCFKCWEPWVPGHTKVCKGKQLYSVILVENAEGKEEVAVIEDTEPPEQQEQETEMLATFQISTQALMGTPFIAGTFTLHLKIVTYWATALVDSGSDVFFISSKVSIKAHYDISEDSTIIVAAAQGKEMTSSSMCKNCSYTIQGQHFTTNFRLLDLKGYDVILGADWIYTHSPVGLDLRKREFTITKNGKQTVTFVDETLQDSNLIIGPKKMCQLIKKRAIGAVVVLNTSDSQAKSESPAPPEEIAVVLLDFADVFQEPTQLPPARHIDHAIPLLSNAEPVNQRTYRLPHHQKNAMEALIQQLLQNSMIRPSVSPYSSLVILVKKKDGTWRLCVDYRNLMPPTGTM